MNDKSDVACTGGHMSYCGECKFQKRWEVVGEFPKAERANTIVIHSDVCMLTKGSRFVKADDVVLQ